MTLGSVIAVAILALLVLTASVYLLRKRHKKG